jgi:hypothetical protein
MLHQIAQGMRFPYCSYHSSTFREIFAHAQHEVAKRFPELRDTIVGAFLILRFVSPAIVTPEAYGLVSRKSLLHGKSHK